LTEGLEIKATKLLPNNYIAMSRSGQETEQLENRFYLNGSFGRYGR